MRTQDTSHALTVPVGPRDHFSGSLDAPLQLLEYGDYQCPFCGRAQPVVEEVVTSLDGQLCFAFRHFPIVSSHPHAMGAAEAAESAGEQGKFWSMHAWLFAHQDSLSDDELVLYAPEIGIDPRRLAIDLANHRFVPRIREDMSTGIRSGVNGTPTFFVNEIRYDGPVDAQSLVAALQWTAPARG